MFIMNSPVLKIYDYSKNYFVETDYQYRIECCFVAERTPKYPSCLRLVVIKSMWYLRYWL